MIYILGVSFEVRGTEHIRKDHGGVVLLNHQSLIDMSGKYFCLFAIVKMFVPMLVDWSELLFF